MRKILQSNDKVTQAAQRKRAIRKKYSCEKKRRKNQRLTWPFADDSIVIKAPFSINIQGKHNRRKTLKFFSQIRSAIIEKKLKTKIDFRITEYIFPTAGILLTAELDRAKRIAKDNFKVSIIPSNHDRINGVLTQVGIAQICNQTLEVSEAHQDESVRHWRYATGERINQQTTKAFEKFEGRLADNLRKGMWRGISEAIANSAQHAYLVPRGVGHQRMSHKRWWMFSQEREGKLTVVVCDLGIGISRSLPLKWEPSTLNRIYDGITGQGRDSRAIRAAMEVGASSTGHSHRGRGLPQIWREIRNLNAEGIVILSNRGGLAWTKKSGVEHAYEYSDNIYGTVISWSVPLEIQDV